jgi:hypothetical protein
MNSQTRIKNPLKVMQQGETLICEIKRHPAGLIGTYIVSGFLLIAVAVIVLLITPAVFTEYSHSKVLSLGAAVFTIFSLLMIGFILIATKVYYGNRWILTSDSITEVTQISLFSKASSQLSLGSLEDVTADKTGVIANIFNYGTLSVETAGERSNFNFKYCGNPNYYATKVIEAREAFEQNGGYRREAETTAAVPQTPQPQAPIAPQPPASV